jgi:hypothetical protein
MIAARWSLLAWIFAVLVTGLAADDKYLLKCEAKPGQQWQVQMAMNLRGKLEIRGEEKVTTLDLNASAQHVFAERVLKEEAGTPMSVGRHYYTAQADITAHQNTQKRTLRPERRTQVATLNAAGTIVYAPNGPLTREELELTADHLDVLALHSLLPGKEVALNEIWPAPLLAAQALAGMDGVTENKLQCQFTQIDGSVATIAVTGSLEGIHRGAELTVVTNGKFQFHLNERRIVQVEWRQQETRKQGPVSPASTIESVTVARWTRGAEAPDLSDGIVNLFPPAPTAGHLLLVYQDGKGRFSFTYDRDWHVVAQSDTATVMRLLERGQLLAQAHITPWRSAAPGSHVTLTELEDQLRRSPGFEVEHLVPSQDVPTTGGLWIGRASALGKSGEALLVQSLYAVASPKGEQVLLSFTTEANKAEKLAAREFGMVKSVEFSKIVQAGGAQP